MIEFVAQLDLGVVGRLQRHRRIDAVAFEMAVVAERVAVLVEGVEAHRDVFVDRLAGIERDAPVAVGAGLHRRFIDAGAVGFLERAVDETAAGAAAEDQRARPLQDFDALGVVEIAEILHVVAKAVDEEVGAGIDAADDEFVAVALALMDRDARNVAGHVGEALEVLVADEFLGHHGDRLRDVDQRRVGLGRDRGAVGVDADGAGARVLRWAEGLRRGLRSGSRAACAGAARRGRRAAPWGRWRGASASAAAKPGQAEVAMRPVARGPVHAATRPSAMQLADSSAALAPSLIQIFLGFFLSSRAPSCNSMRDFDARRTVPMRRLSRRENSRSMRLRQHRA